MVVELNIEKDQDLRAYVKNLVKGQVTSLLRSEIRDIIRDALSNMSPVSNRDALEKMCQATMKDTIHKELFESARYGDYSPAQIALNEAIKEALKELILKK